MATRGLSLVGFYDREHDALAHLRNTCFLPDASDASLLEEWAAARSKLGPPIPRAGAPEIRELEPEDQAYIRELRAQPWVQSLLQRPACRSAAFKLVEIEPLLAHQPFVDLERSRDGGKQLGSAPIAELMRICLPQTRPKPLEPPAVILKQQHSMTIKVRKWHLEALMPTLTSAGSNGYEHTTAGVDLHWSLPFVHVVRLGGRYYLRNGYHRTFSAARRGATHIPCFVSNGDDTEIRSEGINWLLMPRHVLDSSNPPTLGHFLNGRAHEIMLRATSLTVHVTWSLCLMPDEY